MSNFARPAKFFLLGVILLIASLIPYYWSHHLGKPATVVRAAIDVGSGATKLRVAEVDLKSRKIVKILLNTQFTVGYQEDLAHSTDGKFSPEVMKTGLQAFKDAVKQANDLGAHKVVAIATAAFRKADNAENFIQEIHQQTGVDVYVIDQNLEGELAFEAANAALAVQSDNLVVWDVGGGSLQLTAKTPQGEYLIYRGHEASIPFKNFVIETIQQRNIKDYSSPNPLTKEEMTAAEEHARDLAKKVDPVFKEKIMKPATEIVGVGSLFAYGIHPLVDNHNPFTLEEYAQAVGKLMGKTDAELGGGDFVNVKVTNAILVLGFMQGLHIPHMQVIDVNNADGALLFERFWK